MGDTLDEQERLLFLEQVGHLISDGTINTRSLKRAGISFECGNLHAAFLVWKAARRAQVVPLPPGWCAVPVHLTSQMREDAMRYHLRHASFDLDDLWRDLLEAAPKPQEADHIPDASKMVAAPVQPHDLDQAVAELMGRIENACQNRALAAGGSIVACGLVESKRAGIEQQLRQLLATQNKAPRAGAATHAGGNPAQT